MQKAKDDLADYRYSFFLREFASFVEKILQVAFVAELRDDVAVVYGVDYPVAFEDITVC